MVGDQPRRDRRGPSSTPSAGNRDRASDTAAETTPCAGDQLIARLGLVLAVVPARSMSTASNRTAAHKGHQVVLARRATRPTTSAMASAASCTEISRPSSLTVASIPLVVDLSDQIRVGGGDPHPGWSRRRPVPPGGRRHSGSWTTRSPAPSVPDLCAESRTRSRQ